MPVVYLHPIGLDGEMWGSAALPGALTPSFPGFGGTPLEGKPTFERLVDFVADAVRGRGPVDLVGVSLGSMVAQHVAVRRPDLVRSVVLACGGMATVPEVSLERAATTRRVRMAGVLVSTLERWFSPAVLGDESHPGVAYARERLVTDSADVFAAYWEAMAEHDVRAQLPGLEVPATVVAGSADVSVPVATMREVCDLIPEARFQVLEGPHMLPLENPSGFADAVAAHLAWVDR
ncbi:MAG: alpha/beta hydrolase fold protein [Streptosporangiaceae bacterium]|nr:alpha/beta hydrolase fold protein [Streptosporangiaceae bacterium]